MPVGKKKNIRPNPATLRFGSVSAEELTDLAGKFDMYVGDLKALAQAMKEIGLKEVRIDGVTKATRAEKLIREYVDYVEDAINVARRERRRQRTGG